MFFTSASSLLLSTLKPVQNFPDKSILVVSGLLKSKRRMERGHTKGEANPHNSFLSRRDAANCSNSSLVGSFKVFQDYFGRMTRWCKRSHIHSPPLLNHSPELSDSSVDSSYDQISRQQTQGAFQGIRALILAGYEEPL